MSSYSSSQSPMGFGSPRITWAVQRLLFLCIAVFALQLVLEPIQLIFGSRLATFTLAFQPDLFLHGGIWKPFTYQFLHGGLLHLFMNMLWLFFFGPDVERALGSRQFIRFYVACGAVGVLATLLPYFLSGAQVTVTGASGAVMGVLVAFALTDPERQFYLFPLPMPINARALILIIIVMNLVVGLGGSHVSVATHFGGMATGYAYMKLLPAYTRWARERSRPREKKADPLDKLGEEVDNIFRFKDKDSRR